MSSDKTEQQTFLLKNLCLPYTVPQDEVINTAEKRFSAIAGTAARITDCRISKRSVDARKKPDIRFVYSVALTAEIGLGTDADTIASASPNLDVLHEEPLVPVIGDEIRDGRPVIIGFGPCGIFAALLLAENGYRPLIFERGADVEQRAAAVKAFFEKQILDETANIQFGAGGAGTFSDGKLVTRINDSRCRYVLEQFVRFGADPDILVCAKPHIGTDALLGIIRNIRAYLSSLGAELRFHTTVTDLSETTNGVIVKTATDETNASAVILAPGHSARDTYGTLTKRGFSLMPKPYSVGVRIEHLQSMIDRALYGAAAGDNRLPAGEYTLSYRSGERGVYSFCMCPGGEVVAAASEAGGVVVNGMSRHARNGRNANAALAVSVLPEDFGNTVEGAIAFQRQLEQAAFNAGGGTFAAPVQTVGDFLSGKSGSVPTAVKPTYMNGFVTPTDLHQVLPRFVTSKLENGIRRFAGNISGFASPEAVLTGVETRTSAPVRILRNENMIAENCSAVYPAGEGAGYAGGITSAAVDGIKCAMNVMARFAPPKK